MPAPPLARRRDRASLAGRDWFASVLDGFAVTTGADEAEQDVEEVDPFLDALVKYGDASNAKFALVPQAVAEGKFAFDKITVSPECVVPVVAGLRLAPGAEQVLVSIASSVLGRCPRELQLISAALAKVAGVASSLA